MNATWRLRLGTAALAVGLCAAGRLAGPVFPARAAEPSPLVRPVPWSASAGVAQDATAVVPVSEEAARGPDLVTQGAASRAVLRVQCETREGAIVRGPKANRVIALVFTGHEFAEGGETILDTLKARQVRGSFFLTGDFIANVNFEPLLRRIINEGHLLGPHSDKHLLYCAWEKERTTLVTREQFCADLANNREKIRRAIGRLADRGLHRPAGAASNAFETPQTRHGEARPGSDTASRPGSVTNCAPPPVVECLYFLPAYEHYNRQIAEWTAELGLTLICMTPGTRSAADYTGEADRNFVSSQAIFESILHRERQDPHGLNGFILLFHLGAGPGRADKFHSRLGELLDALATKGYRFVRVDELLEPQGGA